MTRAVGKAKRNRAIAGGYHSKWMSGAHALEHLEGDFPRLQAAVRDGAIKGRARGREKDREFWVNSGLTWDDDYVNQVDGEWRSKFILPEPGLINLKEFGEQSELLRDDVLHCFGDAHKSKAAGTQRRIPVREINEFVADYIKRELEAGHNPTGAGLEKEAKGNNMSRDSLRKEFKKQLDAAGSEVRRGRPRKAGK